jgi:hypothetical protein
MMEYAATNRFHNPVRWAVETNQPGNQGDDGVDNNQNQVNGSNTEKSARDNLNMFEYWTKVYLPAHAQDQPGAAAFEKRRVTIAGAKASFGGAFTQKYDEARKNAIRTIFCAVVVDKFRKALPNFVKGGEKTYAIQGLKRVLGITTVDYSVLLQFPRIDVWDQIRKAFDERRCKDVVNLAGINWMYLGASQKWLDAVRSAESYKEYKSGLTPDKAEKEAVAKKANAEAKKKEAQKKTREGQAKKKGAKAKSG